jgi:O-antigen/teichoic acid export membrane protein
MQLGGVAIAIRWPVSLLSGVITGRGRFDILNLLKAGSATIALVGGAMVIVAFADLVAFAVWLAFAACVEVTAYLVACVRLVPGLSLRPRLSRQVLARVWRFAGSMSVISALRVALMQSDHLALSVLAPIEALGYYAVAYKVLGGSLVVVTASITSALFPTFAADYERGAKAKLVSDYNRGTQGLVYVYTLPIAALMFFGEDFLRVWTSDHLAAAAAPILTVLAPGFLVGSSVAVGSTLAMATGNTGMVIQRNVVGLCMYVPLLYVGITRWGAVGAAAAWFLINLSFLFTLLPRVQGQIIGQTTVSWFAHNLLPFLVVGMLSFGIGRVVLAVTGQHGSMSVGVVCVTAATVYGFVGLRLLYPDLQRQLSAIFRQLVTGPSGARSAAMGLLPRAWRADHPRSDVKGSKPGGN